MNSVKEKYLRILGILTLGLIFPFLINLGKQDYYWISAGFATFYTALHWQGTWYILQYFRLKYPDYQHTKLRLFYSIIWTISCVFFINWGIGFVADDLIFHHTIDFVRVWRITLQALILTLSVLAVYEGVYFFELLKKSLIETEKYKNETLQANFAVLKNQVSPHFLFNSLNTLLSLIPEDTHLAMQFTEKLASVYRYILENKDKEVVSLHTELKFLEDYIFLQKIRFGNNLQVNISIDENYGDSKIPPLALQMLVENSVKHNVVSTAKPLKINIFVENKKYLMVKNNLQKKQQVQESTQVGLQNIMHRYEYLTNQKVDVIVTPENFIVALPLLNVSENQYASINN